MAQLESIAFLTYFLARLPADAPVDENTLLLQQDGAIHQISFVALAEALAAESGGGTPVTLLVDTTLSAVHGTVFVNPAEGGVVLLHLPVYGAVSARKGYRIKNIGQGIVRVDAIDGRYIDNELLLDLAPGDRCGLAKDGVNWQT